MKNNQNGQLSIPGMVDKNKIVNVAQVPLRSPFRYPGGKTWLVPRIRQWLYSMMPKPSIFYEPFSGGGIVGLTVAFENLADHVVMLELDDDVASVWEVILSEDAPRLAEQIVSFQMNTTNVDSLFNSKPANRNEQAFMTIVRNRINRGGILANGAGRIKSGENGKGLLSRWYPETLKKRILAIWEIRETITFIQVDALKFLPTISDKTDCAVFIDPPYTASEKKPGRRLYTHSELDHDLLFQICSLLSGRFLMTYDNDPKIQDLASFHSFQHVPIQMKTTHHTELTELLISEDLSWL